MNKQIMLVVFAWCIAAGVTGFSQEADTQSAEKPGLVGARFGEPELTNLKDTEAISTLEHLWIEQDERGHSWSAKRQGSVVAPASGEITFHAETNKSVILEIDAKQILIPGRVEPCRIFEFLQFQSGHMERSGSIPMVKGKRYPITITYILEDGSYGYLRVEWRWEGPGLTSTPPENLLHTAQQERDVNRTAASTVNRSGFVTVPVRYMGNVGSKYGRMIFVIGISCRRADAYGEELKPNKKVFPHTVPGERPTNRLWIVRSKITTLS